MYSWKVEWKAGIDKTATTLQGDGAVSTELGRLGGPSRAKLAFDERADLAGDRALGRLGANATTRRARRAVVHGLDHIGAFVDSDGRQADELDRWQRFGRSWLRREGAEVVRRRLVKRLVALLASERRHQGNERILAGSLKLLEALLNGPGVTTTEEIPDVVVQTDA